MDVINLSLNGIIGEVAWMDTLCNRFYGGWQIDIHPVHIVPFVREIHEAESYIVLRLPEVKSKNLTLPEQGKAEAEQTSLWDHWTF